LPLFVTGSKVTAEGSCLELVLWYNRPHGLSYH
jgi:hypothetical protein